MKRTLTALILGVSITIFVCAAVGAAPVPAYSVDGNSGFNTAGSKTLGSLFQVNTTVIATHLGFFDRPDVPGLYEAHPVGLWNSSGSLLASTIVQAGTASALVGFFRYEPITPVVLAAGEQYVIGGLSVNATFDDLSWVNATGFATAPEITFIEARASVGQYTLQYPSVSKTFNNGYLGANVLFTTVPLPGAAWLFGAALALLGWSRRIIRPAACRR